MEFLPLASWLPVRSAPILIAGPCGAESREQVLETARGLAESGQVSLFRAGVWKPRTRPNTFEGRGEKALPWLVEAREKYGLPFAVEVANAQHVKQALHYKTDVLWVGARTTVNPFAVQEIADALRGTDIPVLIKNPIHADLQLWIGAIERIYQGGIRKIAAVHRGFHFYGESKYRNKPMWDIPIDLRIQIPGLPIICDPSHIGGHRDLVQSLSQEALDLGMDGLMIESHCDPPNALSDAQQQLKPGDLAAVISSLIMRNADCEDDGTRNRLAELRKIIDDIDDELLHALRKRTQVIGQIGAYKKERNITIFQLGRWQEILRTRGQWGDRLGLSRQHVEKLCQLLHEESIRIQNSLMNDPEKQ